MRRPPAELKPTESQIEMEKRKHITISDHQCFRPEEQIADTTDFLLESKSDKSYSVSSQSQSSAERGAREGSVLSSDDGKPNLGFKRVVCDLDPLLQLLGFVQTCRHPKCDAAICEPQFTTCGMALKVQWTCSSGHKSTWDSMAYSESGQLPLPHVSCTSAIVTTGLTFFRLSEWAWAWGLKWYSETTFNDIQRGYVQLSVNDEYNENVDAVIEAAKKKHQVRLAADGQHDSMGYCAKYCTVRLVDADDSYAFGSELIAKTDKEVGGSAPKMEPVGLKQGIKKLLDRELNVTNVVTGKLLRCGPGRLEKLQGD